MVGFFWFFSWKKPLKKPTISGLTKKLRFFHKTVEHQDTVVHLLISSVGISQAQFLKHAFRKSCVNAKLAKKANASKFHFLFCTQLENLLSLVVFPVMFKASANWLPRMHIQVFISNNLHKAPFFWAMFLLHKLKHIRFLFLNYFHLNFPAVYLWFCSVMNLYLWKT